MSRSFRLWLIVGGLGVFCALVSTSCNYSTNERLVLPGENPRENSGVVVDAPAPKAEQDAGSGPSTASGSTSSSVGASERDEQKAAILDNVIKLIQAASIRPGGGHFGNATKNLNQYFEGTPASDFALDPSARAFLETQQLPAKKLEEMESPTWTMPDARHLEDCMLYQGIASRVAGTGDDLTRVRRVFDWMVQQIQLIPPGSLAAPGLGQAQSRPFDVLLRGLATEDEAGWSERGWLFMSLCRQLGLDSGLVTYTPQGAKEPLVWCVAVLIDRTPYLFDPRLGLPIPDAKGDGVATLEEAMTNPLILDRMDLNIANQPAYTTRTALLMSPSKIGIMLDSSSRYYSPRMKLLQQSLAGKNVTILYRDPVDQRERFVEALGPRLGTISFWPMPLRVEFMLFNSPEFVQSTQAALAMFRPDFPLIYARMKQLRGETPEAILAYVNLRFPENPVMMDGKRPIPPELQHVLDVYATHFLGLCHLDQKNAGQAEFFFEKTLQMLPEPGPSRPFFYMFRWGAQANLARLSAAKGDRAKALAYYSQPDQTSQRHGNLLLARDLVWLDPMASCPAPLPAAPVDTLTPEKAVNAK